MKNIRFALVTALLTLGGVAVASAQQPVTPVRPHARAARNGGMFSAELLKGITLSAAEKSNLKNVQAKYAPQIRAVHDQFKPQLDAARAARQRGDTAALKAIRQSSVAEREQTRKVLQAERADLRAALSAENQAKFDANAAAIRGRATQRVSRSGKPGGRTAPGQVPRE